MIFVTKRGCPVRDILFSFYERKTPGYAGGAEKLKLKEKILQMVESRYDSTIDPETKRRNPNG